MSKKVNPLEKTGNKNPFKVPEDYFEHLSDSILSQLPERIDESPQPISIWQRVQPWIYMAAMFCGIALMVNLLRSPRQPGQQGLNLTSSADIEDFYQYYEEQQTNNMYKEAIYINME
ncbi:MAG: hypothetical protein LBS46_06165 [Dysgonamonadaceae bacterium]|jgi:hypothetical protein|nr:hypothetical protein [Dysgonamonadaceae bacterium]